METEKYIIQEGDCLIHIARRYNVDVNELIRLNSDQIDDPNLIFAGNTLIVPKVMSGSVERWQLEEPPETCKKEKNCTCQKHEIADILYVPADPITGNRTWYAVSEEAKAKILLEKQRMESAIVDGDVEATMVNLDKAGILSKFSAKCHEQFLETPKEIDRYKALRWTRKILNTQEYVVGKGGINEALLEFVELFEFDIKERYETLLEQNAKSTGNSYPAYRQDPNLKESPLYKQEINQALLRDLEDSVNKEIEALEDKAIKNASGEEAADGTRYVYMEELEYYSTKREEKVDKALEDFNSSLSNRLDEVDVALSNHQESVEKFERWKSELEDASKLVQPTRVDLNNFNAARNIQVLNLNGYAIKEQCLTAKQLLGDSGKTLGPDALAKIDWRGNGDGEATALDIRDQNLIDALYKEVGGTELNNVNNAKTTGAEEKASIDSYLNNKENVQWAYFPTLALLKVLDVTITDYSSELFSLLEARETPFEGVIDKLLWIKKIAMARLEFLKKLAKRKAAKGVDSLEFTFGDIAGVAVPSLHLVWDENSFQPKKVKKSGFRNKAGYNDLQIVECSFISDGKVFYLRGPSWYLPGGDKRLQGKSYGHITNITNKVTVADKENHGSDLAKVKNKDDFIKKLKEPDLGAKLVFVKVEEQFDTSFWQDSYHYQEGLNADGSGSAYSVDAGAQLMRFTAKGEAELNSPFGSPKDIFRKEKTIGASAGISASFTAMQAQLSVSFSIPQHSSDSNIPEAVQMPWRSKTGEKHDYDIGSFYANIQGCVYGLAAASCQLSAGVELGPAAGNGNFGIRGSATKLNSLNRASAYGLDSEGLTGVDPSSTAQSENGAVVLPNNSSNQSGSDAQEEERNVTTDDFNLSDEQRNSVNNARVAAVATAGADVFAGVEVGGVLSAEVFWFPPVDYRGGKNELESKQLLGSIEGKANVALGAGAKASFRIVLTGGVLLVVTEVGIVFGAGCSGKVAIKVNPSGMDDLVDCLLGLLKQSGFRRIEPFGEDDENGINQDFEILNDVLTVALIYGLTFAKAMLLPFELIEKYKKHVISKEYAPFLAANIITDVSIKAERMRAWVVKMPPETIANVLNALCKQQSGSRVDGDGNVIPARVDNLNQANAIIKIMEWLANDKNELDDINQRQWKETLISMAGIKKSIKNKPLQWQGYKESWFKLARFVSLSSNTDVNNDFELEFDKQSVELCGNMVLVQEFRVIYNTSSREIKQGYYSAFPMSEVVNGQSNAGSKLIIKRYKDTKRTVWEEEQTEWTIKKWSIDDVKI